MKPKYTTEALRELDTIQRNIWARINDEILLRNIKLEIGDAYSLGSVIKEVLHPEVRKLLQNKQAELLDEVEKRVIGEDEPLPKDETSYDVGIITPRQSRNKLRAEKRKILEAIRKEIV